MRSLKLLMFITIQTIKIDYKNFIKNQGVAHLFIELQKKLIDFGAGRGI